MSLSLDSRAPRRLLAGVAAILLMAGCTGDDGDTGAQGPPGPPAIVGKRTVPPEELNPKITDVSVSSPMVVDFQVTDERGFAVVGIDSGVQFTVNKLVPGSDGETDNWRSYTRGADEGVPNVQGSTYSNGTLVDHGNGTYTFTFADELEDISNVSFESSLTHRVGIELRDVEVMGKEIPAGSNAVYDFQPSTGKTSGIRKREIAETESCQTCHGPKAFSFHGGPRKDVEYCVTCHQKDSIDKLDADTDRTIDFRVMIHKIHAATADAQWCGYGCENFGSDPDDFSNVHFPQDVRNCTNCHDPDDPDTPQASNVNNRPTAATCLSCHSDSGLMDGEPLEFDGDDGIAATNHAGGAQPNSTCATCHSKGGLIGSVLASHEIPGQVWAERFEYSIDGSIVSGWADDQSPSVTFSITDPRTDPPTPYTIFGSGADPAFTGGETSVNMLLAWPTSDYTNIADSVGTTVTGDPPSQPVSIPLADGTGTLPSYITDNGDGTYTVDTGAATANANLIPSASLGSGAVVIEGHVSGDFDGDGTFGEAEADAEDIADEVVPVTSAVEYFPINDSSVQARRSVVDPAKCQDCHEQNDGLAFHGNNRTDNTQVCVVCHNPNQTDLFMRPAVPDGDPDGVFNGENTAAEDNLEDRTIDFKYMIHAIHRGADRDDPYIAYGFGVRAHNYGDRHFPRPASDCLACHREGTFELPLGGNVLATTLSSGATVDTTQGGFDDPGATAFLPGDGSASDPTDDNNASATAAVCSSCHDSATAADHMDRTGTSGLSFGNAILLPDPNYPVEDDGGTPDDPSDDIISDANAHTQTDIDDTLDPEGGENCALCHGPGSIADVAERHGVE